MVDCADPARMPPTMTAPTLPDAEAAVLAGLPGCELIDLLLPDMNGLLRGKRITRAKCCGGSSGRSPSAG